MRNHVYFFMGDPREATRMQISNSSLANVIVNPVLAGVFSHPINSYGGTKASVSDVHALKTDLHCSAIWKSEKEGWGPLNCGALTNVFG